MRRELSAILACSILAITTYAGGASAQAPRAPQRPYPPGLSEALLIQQRAEALKVSEEVQAQLTAMIDESKASGAKLEEESVATLAKLQELLNEPMPNEKALLAAGEATGNIAKRMREQRLKTTLRARGLLSEKQLAQYMDIRSRISVPRQGGGQRRR
jgi:Spy/CpxP family protein refolding chaperone